MGMMECKKALVEAGGDMDKAVDNLQQIRRSQRGRKSLREARKASSPSTSRLAAKLACSWKSIAETDFVARSVTASRRFATRWPKKVAANPSVDLEADRQAAVAKIGENIKIARNARLEVSGNGLVTAYIHRRESRRACRVGAGKTETANREEFKQLVRTSPCRSRRDIRTRFPLKQVARKSSPRNARSPRSRIASKASRRRRWKDSGRRARQILPDLLPRGSGFREA